MAEGKLMDETKSREILLYRGKDVREFGRSKLLDCIYELARMNKEDAERHTRDMRMMGDLRR